MLCVYLLHIFTILKLYFIKFLIIGGDKINIIEATTSGFSNIFIWEGRASRSEFWWFYLAIILITFLLTLIDNIVNVGFISIVSGIFQLSLSIAFIATSVRRLHDVGLSGWWYFIAFAPFVIDRTDSASGKSSYLVLFGFMYAIKIFITKGEDVENKYGPKPLTT